MGGYAYGREDAERSGRAGSTRRRTPSRARHQAGITTPAQDRLHFAAFDVTTDLARGADGAAPEVDRRGPQMTEGEPVGEGLPTPYDAPPTDTGEASGLPPRA